MTEFFSSVKDILNGADFRTFKNNYGKIIEQWDSIVGKKFADKSFVGNFFQRGGKNYMLVLVKSSPVAQELGFFKQNLLRKINKNYSVQLADIIIKADADKMQKEVSVKQTEVLEVFEERPSDEELEKIILDKTVVDEIQKSVEKQTALSDMQKERMFNVIINDLKTQEWMKNKGFPICQKCGRVMIRKTFGEENLCSICKNSDIQEG